MKCKKCGSELNENAKFCKACGNKVEKKNGNILFIILIIVLCIVFVGCIGVTIYNIVTSDYSIEERDFDNDKEKKTKKKKKKAEEENEDEEEILFEWDEEVQEIEEPEEIIPPTPKVSTYDVLKSDVTWEQANQLAVASGGYLVSINDAEEFSKVCELAENMGINVFWVGAKRGINDTWDGVLWKDYSPITYTNWFSGEPTYYSEDGDYEEYLMVFKVKGVWYFNDAINDVSQYYSGKMGYIIESEE